jgi:hypothetical protein
MTQGGLGANKRYRVDDADDDDEYAGADNPDPKINDDTPLTEYGHPAGRVTRRTIAKLVKRYYAAAASQNGAKACSLMHPRLRENLRLNRSVPEDQYSFPVHVRLAPGERCAHAMSALFELHHQGLVRELPTLRVTAVRVDGPHGVAILAFTTAGRQWLPVARDGAVWKIHGLLGTLLP